MDLKHINGPEFLKQLNKNQRKELACDIRKFLIDSISKTGGHLGPNLGVVELTMALHTVFDSPKDKIIFDVGHQAYVHKILTGRADRFDTLRQYNGLSGFLKQKESDHDVWEAGHSSTSLSAALGFAISRDLDDKDNHVIAVIGDGALTGGMAFEALNHIGHLDSKVIVVLNDNEMSISPNVGALHQSLDSMRTSKRYLGIKHFIKGIKRVPVLGSFMFNTLDRMKTGLKHKLLPKDSFFEHLGFDYFGPLNGHNTEELIEYMEMAKRKDCSVVLHCVTKKGKGYEFAENDKFGSWHGIGAFDKNTGKVNGKCKPGNEKWSNIIAWTVEQMAEADEDIVTITPAMGVGASLDYFRQKFPNRFFDVGIAEEHATTMAAALAMSGKKPFLSIYSTFLQRAYDQVLHDIARHKANVFIGIDRAGFVGADGETHHGVYDIAFLSHIPDMVIAMGKDANEAQNLVYTGLTYDGPFSLRYPRGQAIYNQLDSYQTVPIGSWEMIRTGKDLTIISYGTHVDTCLNVANELSDRFDIAVVNARYIKPMDCSMIDVIAKSNKPFIVFEETSIEGSLGQRLSNKILDTKNDCNMRHIAIPDRFVEQGSVSELLVEVGLTSENLKNNILEMLS
jgi:1-deoxy-D-xylulose-5-phosphate synthase